MLRTRIEVSVIPKTFTYTHKVELPLDPLLKNMLQDMFVDSINYSDIPSKYGLTGDLALFMTKRFQESFKDVSDLSYSSEELKDMFDNDVYFVKYNESVDYKSYPEFGLALLHGRAIADEVVGKTIIKEAKKRIEKFNLVSNNTITNSETSEDINVESNLTNIRKGRALDIKMTFSKEIVEKVQEKIDLEQVSIEIAKPYTKDIENLNLLTSYDLKELLSKSDIHYKDQEYENIISIKIRRSNIMVSRAYVTNDDIYAYTTDNISIASINGDEDFMKVIVNSINDENQKTITALPKELIVQLLSIKDPNIISAMSEVLKIRSSLLNREFVLDILKLEHFNLFKIYLNESNFFKLFKKLGNNERKKFITIIDETIIEGIRDEKLIKLLINGGFETYISPAQRKIYDEFITSLEKRFEHYNQLIGSISSSGVREGSKSLSKKVKKDIGYSKNVGKWLNENLAHNKNVSMETLDDGAIRKAESILEIANAYIEYVRKNNK